MLFEGISLLPVIASALLYVVIGSIWYSPQLFGKRWMELTNTKKEDCGKCLYTAIAGAFAVGLIMSAVLAHFVNVSAGITAFEGAKVGFLAWLGFAATITFSAVLWERKPLELYFINVGKLLIALLAMGALLAAWR